MTPGDLDLLSRIKSVLDDWAAERYEQKSAQEEIEVMKMFLDTLAGKNCECGAFPFPHKRGIKCRALGQLPDQSS